MLRRIRVGDPSAASHSPGAIPGTRRRDFLRQSALLASSALGVRAIAAPGSVSAPRSENLPPNTPRWMKVQGEPVVSAPYGVPSRYEADVIRRATNITPTLWSSWSFTPLQDLHGIITPNGLVFERHHAGTPDINPEEHRLMVHGLVSQPLIFTIEDLVRLPSISRIHFLECSGNGLTEWKAPKEKTVQGTHGLLSCCEWTGVPLSTILDEVGFKPQAKWILAEGADAAAMSRSIPIEKALDDALLIYAQNGEMLRPEQGYPLRLLLPGFEGNMSVKWLRRLKLGEKPFMTREETSKYTDLIGNGTARQFTFVMEAKSVITFPSGGHQLKKRGPYRISGLAWTRTDQARGCFDGWRKELEGSAPGGTDSHQGAGAVQVGMELGRWARGVAEPRDRRDRLRPADARSNRRGSRHELCVSLQRDTKLADHSKRRGEQCSRVIEPLRRRSFSSSPVPPAFAGPPKNTASAVWQRRRRSPAGIST